MKLRVLPGKYDICRLDMDESIPVWAVQSDFFSVTRTGEELSVVCQKEKIPSGTRSEKDWRVLKIEGPLDFSLIGILSAVSSVLAENKISIFAVSTYDTDYILVKDKDIKKAISALSAGKYEVVQ